MIKRFLFILLFLISFSSNLFSIGLLNKAITLSVEIETIENPYTISIKYNDPELTNNSSRTDDQLFIFEKEYKLTETSETNPFYINISDGKLNDNVKFNITVTAGEFTGLDFNNKTIKTGIIPNITIYDNYEYSSKNNDLDNSLTITKYISKGNIKAQHIGAFTINWEAAESISSGTYTSTNTISVTSENANIPAIL